VLLLENGHRLVRTTPGFSAAHGLVAAPGVEVREGEIGGRDRGTPYLSPLRGLR
jgi:hypothetical protein